MKFVLLAEGDLERKALPQFFKRWLDHRLAQSVRIDVDQIQGVGELIYFTERRAKKHLNDPKQDIIGVIGLFDLHGVALKFPDNIVNVNERVAWAKRDMETNVNHPKFRQFLAVHEIEAWMLSDPDIFPEPVADELKRKRKPPEEVNTTHSPSHLLKELYRTKFKRSYKKVDDGIRLFSNLNPDVAASRCPHLKSLLDEMLQLAQDAGL